MRDATGIRQSPTKEDFSFRGPVGIRLFGCRSPTEDFLYSEEWAGYARRLPGFELINAFSRHDERKVYVQDKLIEEKEKVAALLE